MGYLVRMISRSKWDLVPKDIKFSDYPSHPVTVDLKTDIKNRLSVWRVNSLKDLKAIDDVAVALCVTRDKIRKVEIIMISEEELERKGFTIGNDIDSAQSLNEYNHMHRDIAELKFNCVGNFAQQIVETLEVDGSYRSFTKATLKSLIKARIDNKEIDTLFFESKEIMKKELEIL